mmetsp:Transcript_28142/g.63675  ORF Transcript_28142/g.63675 Transcript_28142/m.63675 type:complete len:316 (+) Transcript_28142:1511-2458(+)
MYFNDQTSQLLQACVAPRSVRLFSLLFSPLAGCRCLTLGLVLLLLHSVLILDLLFQLLHLIVEQLLPHQVVLVQGCLSFSPLLVHHPQPLDQRLPLLRERPILPLHRLPQLDDLLVLCYYPLCQQPDPLRARGRGGLLCPVSFGTELGRAQISSYSLPADSFLLRPRQPLLTGRPGLLKHLHLLHRVFQRLVSDLEALVQRQLVLQVRVLPDRFLQQRRAARKPVGEPENRKPQPLHVLSILAVQILVDVLGDGTGLMLARRWTRLDPSRRKRILRCCHFAMVASAVLSVSCQLCWRQAVACRRHILLLVMLDIS